MQDKENSLFENGALQSTDELSQEDKRQILLKDLEGNFSSLLKVRSLVFMKNRLEIAHKFFAQKEANLW